MDERIQHLLDRTNLDEIAPQLRPIGPLDERTRPLIVTEPGAPDTAPMLSTTDAFQSQLAAMDVLGALHGQAGTSRLRLFALCFYAPTTIAVGVFGLIELWYMPGGGLYRPISPFDLAWRVGASLVQVGMIGWWPWVFYGGRWQRKNG